MKVFLPRPDQAAWVDHVCGVVQIFHQRQETSSECLYFGWLDCVGWLCGFRGNQVTPPSWLTQVWSLEVLIWTFSPSTAILVMSPEAVSPSFIFFQSTPPFQEWTRVT